MERIDLDKIGKQLAKEMGINTRRKRPSGIDRSTRRVVAVSEDSHICIHAYAREKNIYVQAAADRIVREGIKVMMMKDPWPTRTINRLRRIFCRRKPPQIDVPGESE